MYLMAAGTVAETVVAMAAEMAGEAAVKVMARAEPSWVRHQHRAHLS